MQSKTCARINVVRMIYAGELKLLKERSSHSRGKPSIVSGDSRGDRLPIGGSLLSSSFPLLRLYAFHILVDGCSILRLASLCAFLYTMSKGGREPCSAKYCSHRAMSSTLHSSGTTWSWSFCGCGSCQCPVSTRTVVGKAAWTLSNLLQFKNPLKHSQPLPIDQKYKYCLDKEICL